MDCCGSSGNLELSHVNSASKLNSLADASSFESKPWSATGAGVIPALGRFHFAGASIARRRLYFASRSDRVMEPTLMKSPAHPTARSASQSSSVSPLRALTVTLHPARRARLRASRASLSVPIWLTLRSNAVAALSAMARRILAGWVQRRSSPRIVAWGKERSRGGARLPSPPQPGHPRSW